MIVTPRLKNPKFSNEIEWNELVNLAGKTMFDKDNKWTKNTYIKGGPFFKKKTIVRRRTVYLVNTYRYKYDHLTQTYKLSKKRRDLTQHAGKKQIGQQIEEAANMFHSVMAALYELLGTTDTFTPYKVLLGNGSDVVNRIEPNIWLSNYREIIFCTGYIPIKIGKNIKWGRMLFDKKIASKAVKTLPKQNTADTKRRKKVGPEEIKILLGYLARLSEAAQNQGLSGKIGQDKVLRVYINDEQCLYFLGPIASEHGWHISRTTAYDDTLKTLKIDESDVPRFRELGFGYKGKHTKDEDKLDDIKKRVDQLISDVQKKIIADIQKMAADKIAS